MASNSARSSATLDLAMDERVIVIYPTWL